MDLRLVPVLKNERQLRSLCRAGCSLVFVAMTSARQEAKQEEDREWGSQNFDAGTEILYTSPSTRLSLSPSLQIHLQSSVCVATHCIYIILYYIHLPYFYREYCQKSVICSYFTGFLSVETVRDQTKSAHFGIVMKQQGITHATI